MVRGSVSRHPPSRDAEPLLAPALPLSGSQGTTPRRVWLQEAWSWRGQFPRASPIAHEDDRSAEASWSLSPRRRPPSTTTQLIRLARLPDRADAVLAVKTPPPSHPAKQTSKAGMSPVRLQHHIQRLRCATPPAGAAACCACQRGCGGTCTARPSARRLQRAPNCGRWLAPRGATRAV